MIRIFTSILMLFPMMASAASGGGVEGDHGAAAHGGGHAKHEVSAKALPLFEHSDMASWLTNSIFVAGLVTIFFLWFFRSAMKKRALLPCRKQNFVELIVEFLYNQVENIVGPKVAPSAFPLLATIFIYVTVSNWFGLLPGVGTVGLTSHREAMLSTTHVEIPLLRPGTADMNLTFGIAFCALIVWAFITLKEMGLKGTFLHIFGPKGGLQGIMKFALIPIFAIVGVIEVISILFRPMTLSLRLYGNVFAGENLLHTMGGLVHSGNPVVDFIASVLIPLPFYFLEILVGVLQGMVFALLCAVFVKLSTTHDDDHAHDEGHGHAAH